MLTKNDFQQLEQRFATKEDLRTMAAEIIELFNAFREEFKLEFRVFRKSMDEDLEDHDRRLNRLEDKVMP